MRAVISGAAGHIGSHLSALLLSQGHEVIGLDNFCTGHRRNVAALASNQGFTLVEHDVIKPFDPGVHVDWVFHLASPASPPDYLALPLETLAVNSDGTRNLIDLAGRYGARFLFASTSEAYGDPLVHPQPETYWGNVNPNGVRSCYDEAKRFGEALTMAHYRTGDVDARIVRIFNTYGPHSRPDDGRIVPNFICQALRHEPLTIYGDGSQTRSLSFVEDTAAGIALAMASDRAGGRVINLGNPDERTVTEIAVAVSRACDTDVRLAYRPLPSDDPTRRCPDITLARDLLGWEPHIPVEDGLRRAARWFTSLMQVAA